MTVELREIRKVGPEDVDRLLDLYLTFSEEDRRHFTPWPYTRDAIQDHVNQAVQGEAISIIALDATRQVLGHAFVKMAVQTGEIDRVSIGVKQRMKQWIRRLLRGQPVSRFGIGLRASAQGQGVGARLMESIVDAVKALGLRRVRLGVHKDNPRAIRLYKKFGFQIVGELSQQQTNDSVEMELRP